MDWNIKFRCQEDHSKDFAQPTQPTCVYLDKIGCLSLHVLLEHNAVLAVLASGDLDLVLLDLLAYGCVAENVVW